MLQSVQTIHRDSEKNNTTLEKNTSHSKKTTRASTIVLALLPLSACGGGGSTPTTTAPPIAPPPTPDFTEDPTNVFVARDDSARTLDKGTATANLTVTGKAGDDSITTGSGADIIIGAGGGDTISSGAGADFIRGGEGLDMIDAGSGDDVIVVVGTTSADQYDGNDITNPAGSGMDLSSLLSLADLNGRTVSEVVSGETIDGGGGNNTLYIYGTVDLTGVTMTNVNQLVVNSDVTLTQAQINQFTTIKGDGSSVLNITVPDGADGVVLDFSNVDLTGIGEINVSGNITITISSLADLEGVGNFITSGGASFNLAFVAGETPTEISLQEISDMFAGVASINLGGHVTLKIDAPELLAELGITSISGSGSLQADDTVEARTALNNIVLEVGAIYAQKDDFTTAEDTQIYLSISDDILGNDSSLYGSDVTFNSISLSGSSTENATVSIDYDLGVVIITPNKNYTGALELTYNISDFEGNQTSGDVSVDVASVDDPATAYGATVLVPIGGKSELSIDGLVVVEGVELTQNGEQLNIEDLDGDLANIVIHVISISHGSVLKNGQTVTSFTYGDVADGLIEFSHSGGTEQPKLVIAMENDAGVLGENFDVIVSLADINNTIIISQGGTFSSNMVIGADEAYIMTATTHFLYSNSVNQNLTNYGRIEASVTGMGELWAVAADAIETVTNYGVIQTDGGDNSTAIKTPYFGAVVNHGVLSSTVGSSIALGSGLMATTVEAKEIVNSGTILAEGQIVGGVLSVPGMTLNNSGVIYVKGIDEAEGVSVLYNNTDITNSGSVIATVSNEEGASIGLFLGFSPSTVDNSGLIEADIAVKSYSDTILDNTGTIRGDLILSGGADSVTNMGLIKGDITFNSGNDIYSANGGQTIGIVDGGAGNDTLSGGSYADYIQGGNGSDIISTGAGGADHLFGGSGDDLLYIESTDFSMLNGGDGVDAVVIAMNEASIDFGLYAKNNIENIEQIIFDASGSSLSISQQDILEMTDDNNQIMIMGDAGDTVASTGQNWAQGINQVVDGETYHTYTSGDATLLVDTDITQTIS